MCGRSQRRGHKPIRRTGKKVRERVPESSSSREFEFQREFEREFEFELEFEFEFCPNEKKGKMRIKKQKKTNSRYVRVPS